MTKDLSTGDRVSWNTPQGRTHGTVEEKRTKDSVSYTHLTLPTKA